MTSFEEIISSPRIFKIILERFLKEWPGSYDIIPDDNRILRLFKKAEEFNQFCNKIQSIAKGIDLCNQFDEELSTRAYNEEKPIYSLCHAGLVGIVVPIIVDGKAVASIRCGRCRSAEDLEEFKGKLLTENIEKELGFETNELLELRNKIPQVSKEQVDDAKSNLWEVATYVSSLGSHKVRAEKAEKQLLYRLKENEAVLKVMQGLSEHIDNLDIFWKKLNSILRGVGTGIGATHGVFITCDKAPPLIKAKVHVRSVVNLPQDFIKRTYDSCDPILLEVIKQMQPKIMKMSQHPLNGSLCGDILTQCSIGGKPDRFALVPVKLSSESEGVMIFFFSRKQEENTDLSIDSILNLLTQAGAQITTAYENCQLRKSRKWLTSLHSEWLENVSHQLLSPMNEILGQVENLSRSFRKWHQDKPQRIDNTLETLMELSIWAARLANNFAWIARAKEHVCDLCLKVEYDLCGRLIGYARNVQGLAMINDIHKVHVDKDSVRLLNGKVKIDRRFFKQAVLNMLDNAVKYSYKETNVLIDAIESDSYAQIRITNYGIPVKAEEVEKIFEREYRSEAAEARYKVGAGIGLTIARDIIRLHGGSLSVEPSKSTNLGWKTTFTIQLPIIIQKQVEKES